MNRVFYNSLFIIIFVSFNNFCPGFSETQEDKSFNCLAPNSRVHDLLSPAECRNIVCNTIARYIPEGWVICTHPISKWACYLLVNGITVRTRTKGQNNEMIFGSENKKCEAKPIGVKQKTNDIKDENITEHQKWEAADTSETALKATEQTASGHITGIAPPGTIPIDRSSYIKDGRNDIDKDNEDDWIIKRNKHFTSIDKLLWNQSFVRMKDTNIQLRQYSEEHTGLYDNLQALWSKIDISEGKPGILERDEKGNLVYDENGLVKLRSRSEICTNELSNLRIVEVPNATLNNKTPDPNKDEDWVMVLADFKGRPFTGDIDVFKMGKKTSKAQYLIQKAKTIFLSAYLNNSMKGLQPVDERLVQNQINRGCVQELGLDLMKHGSSVTAYFLGMDIIPSEFYVFHNEPKVSHNGSVFDLLNDKTIRQLESKLNIVWNQLPQVLMDMVKFFNANGYKKYDTPNSRIREKRKTQIAA